MKDMYPEIKTNLIERFLNPLYRFTLIYNLSFVINDIEKRMPFNVSFNKNDSILTIDLGDNIIIPIKLITEIRPNNKYYIKRFE